MVSKEKISSLALVGAPGAGKGTIATWLESEHNFYRVCPGDLLRQEVRANTALGQKVDAYLKKGNLIPDDLLATLIQENVKKKPNEKPLLLDGCPRTITQFQSLISFGLLPELLLRCVASKAVLLKRILGRRIHLSSGRVYHIDLSPPKEADIDDITLEPLTVRDDDTLDLALERIKKSQERDQDLLHVFQNYAQTHTNNFKFEVFSTESSISELKSRLVKRLNL